LVIYYLGNNIFIGVYMETNVIEKLDQILKGLADLKISQKLIEQDYESQKTEELNEALALASLEFPIIKVNRQNPYLASGYSDLHEIMVKVRPVLGKHGLSITQRIKLKDSVTTLATRLWHLSGQWIESRVLISPTKNTIESYGSNLNSMKRFEVMDLLGVTVSEDPFDDDGEADMEEAKELQEGGAKLKALYTKKSESYAVVNNTQYGELMKELDDDEDLTEDILNMLHIRSLRELPASRFSPTVDRIRKIKKLRRGN